MTTTNDILSTAAKEIGYYRHNDPESGTKYGRWYAAKTGSSYYGTNGVPFCAMFVSWVFDQRGMAVPGLPVAYVPYLENGAASIRLGNVRDAQPGDIVTFNWDGGVSDHVGLVEKNCGSYIQTIEGNSPEGYVSRRTRAWNVVAKVFRPAYSGTSAAPVPSAPASGALAVDGQCGPATIRKWQQVMGTPVDGIISGQVVPDNKTYGRPNLVTSCVRYGGGGSTLIKAVQRVVGTAQDGLLGPDTIRAIQRRLGVNADAWFGPDTVKALQRRLNENRF